MAKWARVGSKVATRLPSTGLKMAKMANLMQMGDTCDTLDSIDTFRSRAGRRGGWLWRQGCATARCSR
jgi:hypothetical protein